MLGAWWLMLSSAAAPILVVRIPNLCPRCLSRTTHSCSPCVSGTLCMARVGRRVSRPPFPSLSALGQRMPKSLSFNAGTAAFSSLADVSPSLHRDAADRQSSGARHRCPLFCHSVPGPLLCQVQAWRLHVSTRTRRRELRAMLQLQGGRHAAALPSNQVRALN
jgi:hypothetical protein